MVPVLCGSGRIAGYAPLCGSNKVGGGLSGVGLPSATRGLGASVGRVHLRSGSEGSNEADRYLSQQSNTSIFLESAVIYIDYNSLPFQENSFREEFPLRLPF